MDQTGTLTFKLAKLMVALAWADGAVTADEVNALKELLFPLKDLTARDWAQLDLYMDSPVTPEETEALLQDVLASMRSRADKEVVLEGLQTLMAADGHIDDTEGVLFGQIKKAIEDTPTDVRTLLTGLVRGLIRAQTDSYRDALNRERDLDSFIRNRILYDLRRAGEQVPDLSDNECRKLCAAAALLGRVAASDHAVSEAETHVIADTLQAGWGLAKPTADLLAQITRQRIAEGMEYHHVIHTFYEGTTGTERSAFIRCLFRIANASEKTSLAEIEDIRDIAICLKVPHTDFVEAKLTVPRDDRKGL